MKVNNIVDGLVKYINKNLYPTMTDWQKILAADIVSRAIKKAENIENTLANNAFIQALGYIDAEGNVEIESTIETIKQYINNNGGKWKLKIPLMPEYAFSSEDIDIIYNEYLKE